MTTDYIEPGSRLADEKGNEITVLREVHGGRYEVRQAGGGARYVLSPATIRQLYPKALALAAAITLILASVAAAAPGVLAKAKAIATPAISSALMQAQANAQAIQYMTVTCKGAKRIVCTAKGPGAVVGASSVSVLAHATLTAAHGQVRLVKVTVAQGAGAV